MTAMPQPTNAPRARTRAAALAAVVVFTVALAACGGGDDDGGDDDAATDTTERTTTTLPPVPPGFDWWSFTELPLGGDWTLRPCEGSDSSLCFDQGEGTGGFVGTFRFDVPADFDLNVHAARFVEDFRTDRRTGCGSEYRVEAEPIESLDLPDGPARRYGFLGGALNSADTERTIQWAGVRGTSLVIVTLSAYDPGSCVDAVGEATLDELEDVLPAIDQLILTAGLPDPAGFAASAG